MEKQKQIQQEKKRQELIKTMKTLTDKELKINIPHPKAPISAFMHFSREIRLNSKDSSSIIDASRQASVQWKNKKDNEKRKYEEIAEQDKQRFRKETIQYQEKLKYARQFQLESVQNLPLLSIVDNYGVPDIKIALSKLVELNTIDVNLYNINNNNNNENQEIKRCAWCNRSKEKDLLKCSVCNNYYHFKCLELPKETLENIHKYGVNNWKCGDCKDCTICKQSSDDSSLLLCDSCDRGFHLFCLTPPLTTPPSGNWVCNDCVFCISCNSTSPGPLTTSTWQKDFTMCEYVYCLTLFFIKSIVGLVMIFIKKNSIARYVIKYTQMIQSKSKQVSNVKIVI